MNDNKRVNLGVATVVSVSSVRLLVPLLRGWRISLILLRHAVPAWGRAVPLRLLGGISRLLGRIIARLTLVRIVHRRRCLLPLLIGGVDLLLLPLTLLIGVVKLWLLELAWSWLMNDYSLLRNLSWWIVAPTTFLAQIAAANTHQHITKTLPEVICNELN